MKDCITIKGARENNLKNIDLTVPRNKLIVFTGLSGSGKSSLAFETILQKGSGDMLSPFRHMPASFWAKWTNPMLTTSRGFHLRFQLTRKAHQTTRGQQSVPLRRFMTI